MSTPRWCDIGMHCFPEGQFGATTFGVTQNVKNQWGGYSPSEKMQEACAACAKDSGIKSLTDLEQSEDEALEMAYRIRDGHVPPPKAITNGEPANGKIDELEKDEIFARLQALEAMNASTDTSPKVRPVQSKPRR